MIRKDTLITRAGLDNLEKELADLRSNKRSEVAKRIYRANETGGTVDNAEYDEAKNEQAFIEGRIRELENILSNAVVAPDNRKSRTIVKFGSSITILTDKGSKRNYTVVGKAEASPLEGKISNESPVGRALLGRKIGDKVEVETPSGIMNLTIHKIR